VIKRSSDIIGSRETSTNHYGILRLRQRCRSRR
jgi:hypothetical protein